MLDAATYALLMDIRHAAKHAEDKLKALEIIARIDALVSAANGVVLTPDGEPVEIPTRYSEEDRRADEALERAGERAYPECPEY
jgi:hypothetical protein